MSARVTPAANPPDPAATDAPPRPKVSICLPNLNHRRFLPARLESIFAQTLRDWELIVSDNFSDDGAWEYLGAACANEPRARLAQAPREGMYANWNNCLRAARGDFVYFATSDDTMEPDCLATLAAALDRHPECGLAHCNLTFVDEEGQPSPHPNWEDLPLQKFFWNGWLARPHLRRAPHDGILHAATGTVYTSITQLLIRRSLFERTGPFRDGWGAAGDFAWGCRAGFATDVLHVPRALATWRRHPQQETQDATARSVRERQNLLAMVEDALDELQKAGDAHALRLDRKRMTRPFRHQLFRARLREAGGAAKFALWAQAWAREPDVAWAETRAWVKGGPVQPAHLALIRRELERVCPNALVPLDPI